MSDYIAELRRELVGAAEREQRRRAPRRELGRARRPLALALAGAVAAAALVVGIVRELPAPAPAGPRVAATIRLGGIPVGGTLAGGRVWISDNGGSVLALDPKTRRRAATVAVGTATTSIAASRDALWVVAARDPAEQEYRLLRIDPATNRIVARIASFGPFGASLAATPDAAWVQTEKQDPGPLRRVDPADNRIGGDYGRHGLAAMAGRAGRLWLLRADGVLEWRDAGTGRPLGAAEGFAANPPGGAWRSGIAPEADGAFIVTAEDGAVTRVASDGRYEWSVRLRANGPIARARGALWVSAGDELTGRHNSLLRLAPGDGHVTGRIPLGARVVQALLPVGNELWAVVSDGTVLVVK
jgi:hypothetical protein